MEALQFTEQQLGQLVGSFLWPMFRIMGFLMAAPVVGSQLVPMRIRVVLAVATTLVIAPLLPAVPEVAPLSLRAAALIVQQVLIGIALGFFLQMVFQALVLSGQMVAMQMGLGFASMMDPANGISVTVLSSFYLMFLTAFFIALDGHLQMLELLVSSFYLIPIAVDNGFVGGALLAIINSISWVFSSAMIIALPALTALLITNFSFGVMTRAAPQLNIFALGFPIALILGLFIAWLTMPSIADASRALIERAFLFMDNLLLM